MEMSGVEIGVAGRRPLLDGEDACGFEAAQLPRKRAPVKRTTRRRARP